MSNKYLYVVMATVMIFVGFFLSHMPFLANDSGGPAFPFYLGLIVALGLGPGQTGGSDAISIFIEGVKDYIPTLINFAIIGVLLYVVVGVGLRGEVFAINDLLNIVGNLLAASLTLNLTISYLKKAN